MTRPLEDREGDTGWHVGGRQNMMSSFLVDIIVCHSTSLLLGGLAG